MTRLLLTRHGTDWHVQYEDSQSKDAHPDFHLERSGRGWRSTGLREQFRVDVVADQEWITAGSVPEARIRVRLHRGVSPVWTLQMGSLTAVALDAGMVRSSVRQLSGLFTELPSHLVLQRSLPILGEAGDRIGAIRSRRTLPVSYLAQSRDSRITAPVLAALTVLVGSYAA